MSKADEVLAYIKANPGCMSSGANKAVRTDQSFVDWIYTRREIDDLVRAGLVVAREYRGISTFYANCPEKNT